jgi:DNA-binding GntR family transcriptional regulator
LSATLGDSVYRGLVELFVSGQVAPGDRLSLRTLAAQLGTSAMPVREALRQLAALGAVQIEPQRAARVPLMGEQRFRDLLQIRLLIEGLAAERAASRIDAKGLKATRRACDAFAAEIRKPRPAASALVRHNKDFHFAVYEAAGSPELLSLIEQMWLLIGPVVNYDLRQDSERLRTRPALLHHERLVRALERGEPQAAREALQGDLASAGEIIIASGQLA